MNLKKIVRTAFVFPVALVFYSLASLGVAQADSIYMTVEGENQGPISDNASPGNTGHADEITVFGFGHSITIPTDPQSGRPTGQRIHQPLRIFKAFDNSSPKLYQALVTGERLSSVVIKFYRVALTGQQEHYYTIELRDALIKDITAAAGSDGNGTREVVSYTYRTIIWTVENGGITAQDDWRTATP